MSFKDKLMTDGVPK